MSSSIWYELEIQPLCAESTAFYPVALYNRPDDNAGYDLFASHAVHVEKQQPQFIPFGIAVRMLKVEPMPNGAAGEVIKTDSHYFLLPRSSIYKTGMIMGNSMGVIDKSYRGELKAPVWTLQNDSYASVGDRLFQIVAPEMGWIRHIRTVDSLPETSRGAGGFGSTGK